MRLWIAGALAVAASIGTAVAAEQPTRVAAAIDLGTPTRVLDTRSGLGGPATALEPGVVRPLMLPAGFAGDDVAVALNLTSDRAAGPGWISAWSCADPQPATSIINVVPGRAVPNMVALRSTPAGLCFTASTRVDLIADVTAVMSTADYTGVAPRRLLDTRDTTPLVARTTFELQVAGSGNVPPQAPAAALNVTVVAHGQPGFVSVTPCGSTSAASTVNFLAGEIVPHFTFTGLGGGRACITASTAVDVVVDSFGWLPQAGALDPVTPARVLDTRTGVGGRLGAVANGETVQVRVAGYDGIPNTAEGATVNIVAVNGRAPGYVNTWPCDAAEPRTSTLNLWPGILRSNQATLRLSAGGELCLRPMIAGGSRIDLVMDVVGSVAGTVARPEPPPTTPPTTTIAPPAEHFATLPVGAALPSGAECAERVRPTPENRPDNAAANQQRGAGANTRDDWAGFARVDGDFTGTTDEIIQWAACKWGIDEDIARAQLVKESAWHQSAVGDNGESFGLGQVRCIYHAQACVNDNAIRSSAYNVDYTYAVWRACYEGVFTWLNQGERGQEYTAGDEWGCVGVWFSGRWYTHAAVAYIEGGSTPGYGDVGVRQHLQNRTWETADFANW